MTKFAAGWKRIDSYCVCGNHWRLEGDGLADLSSLDAFLWTNHGSTMEAHRSTSPETCRRNRAKKAAAFVTGGKS